MNTAPFPLHQYPDDVTTIRLADKTVLLVGTAHVSQLSTDLVTQVIEQEQPDTVCIELDDKRFAALTKRNTWENLDLKQVVRSKQLATLMVNLLLATYQKKLGGQLGIMPGSELLAAAQTAEQHGIPIVLCDRDVRVTLRRAWRATSWINKGSLLAMLLATLFDSTELNEAKLEEMRRKDVLAQLISELGATLPHTKAALIDERDIYMAETIKQAAGKRLVAVVGAGHTEGIQRVIHQENSHLLATLGAMPVASSMGRTLGWMIPGLIFLALITIGLRQGVTEFTANALYWILAHGIPSSLGAVIALAHPATIVSAFAAAPITSLSPLIGAGTVCAFIQVMTCPPVVKEFEAVSRDLSTFTGWWRNKLLRIFLVFILTTLGSVLGTWIGGYRIVNTLLN
jgi:pheromone shutdown-related protein TraB